MLRLSVMGAAIALGLSACAHGPTSAELSRCGYEDGRPWVRVKEPPPNADELRRLAEGLTDEQGEPTMRTGENAAEVWFTLPSGEIMLCRIEPYSTEWWTFEQTDEGPKVTDYGGEDIIVL